MNITSHLKPKFIPQTHSQNQIASTPIFVTLDFFIFIANSMIATNMPKNTAQMPYDDYPEIEFDDDIDTSHTMIPLPAHKIMSTTPYYDDLDDDLILEISDDYDDDNDNFIDSLMNADAGYSPSKTPERIRYEGNVHDADKYQDAIRDMMIKSRKHESREYGD